MSFKMHEYTRVCVCVCVCVSPVYPGEVLQGILKEYQVHSLVVLIVLFQDLQIQYTVFTHNCWCISWIQNARVCVTDLGVQHIIQSDKYARS